MTIKAKLRISWLAGAALLAAAPALTPALADVKAGVDAWSRGDYAKAIAEWKTPADRGDSDAMFNLGQAYKLGRGVPVDLAKAEDLFGKAAAKGHIQAADNYGLLLFQRGEQARAMPYIKAASDRGDPRSQYLLGIAHFNGDNVAKDWVRAYALVSLAQQAGLAQAAPALSQMDKYIPLDQRQQSVNLASQLASAAQATRERQIASADLGVSLPAAATAAATAAVPARVASAAALPGRVASTAAAATAAVRPAPVSPDAAVAIAERIAGSDSPRTAGADFARPQTPAVATAAPAAAAPAPTPAPAPARVAAAQPQPKPPVAARPAATPAPAAASTGAWRVQLGAFGVPSNAEAMWNRVKARPEIAGRTKLLVPAGKIAKLQAGGFASQAEAQTACSRLSAAGFTCLPVRN
ncbi:SPOR domain-containing protein [Novosphingobium sp. JCM 18896]|uniref:SPOR domain-containing protein n=1 Tax=Novosphingobium sp. JCM 18896 TaxID=2989731 RepID=UPI002222E9F6|nr:SPOR domain-containing protein [Novosphingobium sp. JCM 18896]MCW1427677.1 SPOR domain-containing protein [Novosphingobium sp. JCM 18896]